MKDLEGLPTIHYTEMAEQPADSPIYRAAQLAGIPRSRGRF